MINAPAHRLTFHVVSIGQPPFDYLWSRNGSPILDDTHHSNSGTANLVVQDFGPEDAGQYQVVISNAYGMATSQVACVVIHCANAAASNPTPPYSTWATAATNIQDAVDAASAGDIVLVTNGVYAYGGKVLSGGLTNRVAVDKPITVTSVNGYGPTIIQGAWDPATTNGPLAVRCAALTDGAVLNGFTLRGGATHASSSYLGAPDESGGGAWCSSTNALVANCVLTNNAAIYGGGVAYGMLDNSLVVNNLAMTYGGGAFSATVNNSTIMNNRIIRLSGSAGAGTYNCTVRNSILLANFDWLTLASDNFSYNQPSVQPECAYSCTAPLIAGPGNIDGDSLNPQFLDLYHIAATSPCRGAGSALYASGTDLDGEPWANPPSMGCNEVIPANLTGPLSDSLSAYETNLFVMQHFSLFTGNITGRASRVAWSFGDGPTVTNLGATASHRWAKAGNYTVTFTAYNNDHPQGVSASVPVHVVRLKLQSALVTTNGFEFQFEGWPGASYSLQTATNLTPPVNWQLLKYMHVYTTKVVHVTLPPPTNGMRFYRMQTQ